VPASIALIHCSAVLAAPPPPRLRRKWKTNPPFEKAIIHFLT